MFKAKEKRKQTRFEVPFCLECRHPDLEKTLSGVIKNISMGGISLLVDFEGDLPEGKPLSLSLLFPDAALGVNAKVIWQKKERDKNRIGALFFNLPDSFKEGIYQQIFKYHREQITSKWWSL